MSKRLILFLLLWWRCCYATAEAHPFGRSLDATANCVQQTVGNATCLRDLTRDTSVTPRYLQVFCSVDRTQVGQVSYSDPLCTVITDTTVVPSGICMLCPAASVPLNSYLPELQNDPYISTFLSGCIGNTETQYFRSPNSCAYVEGSTRQLQQTYTCDAAGVGTLSTFNNSDGSCSGRPEIVQISRASVCIGGLRRFSCPGAEQDSSANAPRAFGLFSLALAFAVAAAMAM
jgi:hypothetical protein